MVSPQGEWIYMIVEDLILHCFSTSIENLEQAMQVSGWDALWVCAHTSTHTRTYTCVHWYIHTCRNTQREIIFFCCPSLCNVSLCPSPSNSGARLQWVGWAALWRMCAGAQQGCDCMSQSPAHTTPSWTPLGSTQLKLRKTQTTLTCGVRCRDAVCCNSSCLSQSSFTWLQSFCYYQSRLFILYTWERSGLGQGI